MRKDVSNCIDYMKQENLKINYAAVARQYDCDPRTVKRYYESNTCEIKERKKRQVTKKLIMSIKKLSISMI